MPKERTDRGPMWRRTILPVLTYIAIAIIGQALIPDELYDMVWLVASAFISLVAWHYVNRHLDRRGKKD